MSLSKRRRALLERLHRRRTREREGLFLVEGSRAVRDALAAAVEVRFALRAPELVTTDDAREAAEELERCGIEVVDVGADDFARAADTETPQGVLAVCAEPGWELESLREAGGAQPRVLLLDAVQDPGNAGTLVRAAAAFGLTGVVALDGTVDPWSPKAVRASAGGVLRVPVVVAGWEEVRAWLDAAGVVLLASDGAGEDVGALPGSVRGSGWALAVGNEGAGHRRDLTRRAHRVVSIPMPGEAESLNVGVAGAILMYALTRPVPPEQPE